MITEPTLNPLTGKKFESDEEKQTFIAEQKVKSDAVILKIKEESETKQTLQESATVKLRQYFIETVGLTEDEFYAFFSLRPAIK